MNPEPVKGLLLAGGYSRRMQTDKAFLQYNEEYQYIRMLKLLQLFCSTVHISCRPEQVETFRIAEKQYGAGIIPDQYRNVGPLAALLAAFYQEPGPWLVLACDLPLVDKTTLEYLLQNQDPGCIATAYQVPGKSFPEPLITIWENAALPFLEEKVNENNKRLVSILQDHKTRIISPADPEVLRNVNTPEDYQAACKWLSFGAE